MWPRLSPWLRRQECCSIAGWSKLDVGVVDAPDATVDDGVVLVDDEPPQAASSAAPAVDVVTIRNRLRFISLIRSAVALISINGSPLSYESRDMRSTHIDVEYQECAVVLYTSIVFGAKYTKLTHCVQ